MFHLDTVLNSVIPIARDAGQILLQHFDNPIITGTKSTDGDIVTIADKESERWIVSALTAHFPEHHIVGEEGGGMGAPAETADFFWYVDPLDGTVNYAAGMPFFSTSIALTDSHRQPLAGVVYDPWRDELFTAVQGKGAYLNGHPLHVSTTDSLAKALLSSGFPYDKHLRQDNNLAEWAAFLVKVRDLRRLGSAALDLCYVAAGRMDGFWEQSLNPWDVLAGMLIVREAGGMVTDYHGSPNPQQQDKGKYLASNGHLHPAMLAVLETVKQPPDA